MKLPDFSAPERMRPIERAPESLIATRHFYHSLAGPNGHNLRSLTAIGTKLGQSPQGSDWLQAGWAFAEAALQTGSTNKSEAYLNQARTHWRAVRDTAYAPELYIQARYAGAYWRTLREVASGQPIDGARLLKRLRKVNRAIVHLATITQGESTNHLRGLANEVAVATLTTRYYYPKGEGIGWIATPWQDQGPVSKDNFDVIVGDHPYDDGYRIQVKSCLDPTSYDPDYEHKKDGELQYERERRKYDDSMTLIFGDVHLRNTPDDPYYANGLLADMRNPLKKRSLDVIMANVVDEIDASISVNA